MLGKYGIADVEDSTGSESGVRNRKDDDDTDFVGSEGEEESARAMRLRKKGLHRMNPTSQVSCTCDPVFHPTSHKTSG